jgi:hypothetical protein
MLLPLTSFPRQESPVLQDCAAAAVASAPLDTLETPALPALDAAATVSAGSSASAAPNTVVAPPRGHFAGLFDFSRDDWRCSSCVTGEHDCCMCGVAGQEGVAVFRCSRMCGKYYHLQCLAKNPLTQWLTPPPPAGQVSVTKVTLKVPAASTAEEGSFEQQLHLVHGAVSHSLTAMPLNASASTPPSLELEAEPVCAVRFVCPFHTCSGCKQSFDAFHPPLFYRCHACPTAYHVNCVPHDTRLDMVSCCFVSTRGHSHSRRYEYYSFSLCC